MKGESGNRFTIDIAELAVLVQAVAESADDQHGRPRWGELAGLIHGKGPSAAGSPAASGAAELARLRRQPGNPALAEALARVIRARADLDAGFAEGLAAWLGQKHVQALMDLSARRAHATAQTTSVTEPKPWYRRTATYIAGVATTVLAAALIAIVTNGPGSLFGGHSPLASSGTGSVVPSPGTESAAGQQPASPKGQPVQINAVDVLAAQEQGAGNYALPGIVRLSSGELGQLNSGLTWPSWLAGHGAVAMGGSVVQVAVTGNSTTPAQIIGINVVRTCGKPLTGTAFLTSGSQGQGQTIPVNFNLNTVDPVALTPDGASYFAHNTLTLADGEQQTLALSVTTKHYYCQYEFQLVVLVGKTKTVELVANSGMPFKITAAAPYSQYGAIYAGGELTTSPGYTRENPATFTY